MKLVDKLKPSEEEMNKFDYATQKKIANLIVGDVICFLMFILLAIAMFVAKINFSSAILISVATCLFFTSIIFVKKAKVFIASWLTTIGLLASCVVIAFFSHTGSDLVNYRTGCFCVAMAAVNMLISLNTSQLLSYHIASELILIISCFTTYLSVFKEDPKAMIASLVINFLGLLTANSSILAYSVISKKLIKYSENQNLQTQENLKTITNALAKANESLNIGKQLNDAANSASQSVSEIGELYKKLIADTEYLRNETQNVKQAGEIVTESATNMSNSINNQNEAIIETSTAMTEITANVANINDSAKRRHSNLSSIADILDHQQSLVEDLVKQVEQVKESSNEIAKFVQTVDSIAGQTNLLAMNASIEAAHAGAMGKGFGVIAQEIRKLSVETTRNAKLIAETLKSNTELVQVTSNSVAEFANSTTNSSEEIRKTVDSMTEIISGLAEITNANFAISQEIQVLTETSAGNEEIVNTVLSQIDNQDENIVNITNLADNLNERVNEIKKKLENINGAVQVIYNGAQENEKVSKTIASLLH